MSLISKQFTFTTGATIVASEHNTNFDTIYNDYNGNINNANLSASANIADTKLAAITTAGKVNGTAITNLPGIPSGAGKLPSANAGVPTGSMIQWPTDTAPTQWVLCDGGTYNAVSDTTFQALFDVIGNTFSGADNTDFGVPDMRGRFALGQDDMGGTSANRVTDVQADTIGGSGGSETRDIEHTHTSASHTHPQNTSGTISTAVSGNEIMAATTEGSEMFSQSSSGSTFPKMSSGVSAGSGGTTGAGGNTAVSVLSPFLTLNYIIKK